MDIRLLCPFSASAFLWAPEVRSFSITVVVKATFSLVHGGEAALAAQQDSIHDDIYWDGAPRASLYAPSDFAPRKPRADVLLAGHAYAPGGAPIETLIARLQVGDLSKALRLTGDRAWIEADGGLSPGPPTPFVEMPLRYERAARHPENPIGPPLEGGEIAAGLPLPNLQAVDPDLADATPGFGPLHPRWRAVQHHLSDDASVWAHRLRGSLEPAPEGFDFGFFNSAPRDQQVDRIEPGVEITLEHLHPWIERFETRLPAVWPKVFRVDPASGAPASVPMRCDTIWIDTYRTLAVLSWRGDFPVPDPDDRAWGRLVVATETPDKPVRYEDIEHTPLEPLSERGRPAPPGPRDAAIPLDRTVILEAEPAADLAPAPPAPRAVDLPLERCAAIAAQLDVGRADPGKILGAHGLTEGEWAGVARRWAAAIRLEIDRGVLEMLEAFDRTYVDQIERARGPIRVEEYAQLLASTDPGAGATALAGLTLPPEGLLRVKRAGLRRLAADAEFAAKLLRAIAAQA
jgi:hypothetical protein